MINFGFHQGNLYNARAFVTNLISHWQKIVKKKGKVRKIEKKISNVYMFFFLYLCIRKGSALFSSITCEAQTIFNFCPPYVAVEKCDHVV